MPSMRGILHLILALALAASSHAADDVLRDLQRQLAAAQKEEAPNSASIAEIGRRILAIDPRDQSVREKQARALLDLGDLRQCRKALDQWEAEVKSRPAAAIPGHGATGQTIKIPAVPVPAILDVRGDLALEEKHYEDAVRDWTEYLRSGPNVRDAYDKIAWVHELRGQWPQVEQTLDKLIAFLDTENSASSRAWRARCRLELRKWDDAEADIRKANAIDATDSAVKDLLPQFELLDKSLPKIKALDKKIAAGGPQSAMLLLDRGQLLQVAQRPELALQDADAALAIWANSRRAILQKGRALAVLNRTDEAGKLKLIVKSLNFPDAALQKIGALDVQIEAKPGDAKLLTGRAWQCNDINQYALAMEDADTATSLDPHSADALVESGFASMKLGRAAEAKQKFMHAIELDPKNATAWRSLGELEMDRANYPDAIDFFTRSLKLHESPLVLEKLEQCHRYSGHDAEADQDHARWQQLTGGKKK